MQDGPLQRYRPMVFKGELTPDTAQELAEEKLQLLANRLAQYSETRLGDPLPFVRRRRSAAEGSTSMAGSDAARSCCSICSSSPFTTHRAPRPLSGVHGRAHEAIDLGRKVAADPTL